MFGVVKYEVAARELAQVCSFAYRWDHFFVRYCRSPLFDNTIPPFAVFCRNRLGRASYYGFFKNRDAAQRLADNMKAAYPGIIFHVRDISSYDVRASNMDSEPALF